MVGAHSAIRDKPWVRLFLLAIIWELMAGRVALMKYWIVIWLIVPPCFTQASDSPQIYRSTAPDGTLEFSDRPRFQPGRRQLNHAVAIGLPETNLLAPPVPGHPQSTPHSKDRARLRLPAREVAESNNCGQLRRQLQELWRERRTGYRLQRGPELKRLIRERQAELKTSCGQWR